MIKLLMILSVIVSMVSCVNPKTSKDVINEVQDSVVVDSVMVNPADSISVNDTITE